MAVDRCKREEVAANLAALMRGEIGRAEIDSLRHRLFPEGWPAADPLALYALDRLHRNWRGRPPRSRFKATPLQWEKLRRWIAILKTDLDWDQSGYSPDLYPEPSNDWLGCLVAALVWPLTVIAIIASSQLYDGRPLMIWLTIGFILSPALVGFGIWLALSQWEAPKPFASVDQMNRCMPHADSYQLPAYDPHVHGSGPFMHFIEKWLPVALNSVIIFMLAVAAWPALIVILWLVHRERRSESSSNLTPAPPRAPSSRR